jgi:membrane protein
MVAYFRPPIGWWQVARRTVHEISDDNCLGLAAQMAFYFLLGLFPALLVLVALLSYLPEDFFPELLAALSTVAPPELIALVRGQLDQIAAGEAGGLLTLGILGAIWSSSVAMVAIIDALNRAYDIVEWRPWWKRRLLAIVLTVASSLFILLSFALVLIGPTVLAFAGRWLLIEPAVVVIWAVLRWPLLVGCIVFGVDLVYHFAPNRRVPWTWITPGALLATVLWVAISFGFKYYVANFGDYTATYGAIGGAIVTMLWFYLGGLAILVGAEINGVIEHALRDEGQTSAIGDL